MRPRWLSSTPCCAGGGRGSPSPATVGAGGNGAPLGAPSHLQGAVTRGTAAGHGDASPAACGAFGPDPALRPADHRGAPPAGVRTAGVRPEHAETAAVIVCVPGPGPDRAQEVR